MRIIEALKTLYKVMFGGVPQGLRQLPGPPRRFPFGNGIDFLLQPPWVMTARFAEKYGPLALAWLGPMPLVMLTDPESIRRVLIDGDPKREVYKAEPVGALLPASPPNTSSFVLNGHEHERARKYGMTSHPQYGAFLDDLTRRVVELAKVSANTELAKQGSGFDRRMHRFVFDACSIATVGEPLGNSSYRAAMTVFRTLDFRMRTNLPLVSPFFYFARRSWWNVFRRRVAAERAGQSTGSGLLTFTLRGSHVSLDQFAIALSNVFPGGFFSTTAFILNALVSMHRPPEVAKEVRDAIRAEAAKGGPLTHDRLAALKPLERVARETLRLYTPVPLFMRRVGRSSLTLQGHELEPQTMMAIGAGPIHLSKERWPDPLTFNPSRWTDEVIAANPYGSDWFFPFGRGIRECEGRELALTIFRAVICGLYLEHEVVFEGSGPIPQRFFFAVMTPKTLSGSVRPLPPA